MHILFKLVFTISLLAGSTAAYTVKKTWDASNFFDEFNFYSVSSPAYRLWDYHGKTHVLIPKQDVDPTHGFVNYVNKHTALSAGLAKITNGKVRIGADSNSVLDPNSKRGRKSVRLESKAQFDHGLLIGDFDHLPGSACGIWPSL